MVLLGITICLRGHVQVASILAGSPSGSPSSGPMSCRSSSPAGAPLRGPLAEIRRRASLGGASDGSGAGRTQRGLRLELLWLVGQAHVDGCARAVADQRDRDLVPRMLLAKRREQILRGLQRASGDRHEDVARLDVGLIGWSASRDLVDEDASALLNPKLLGQLGGEPGGLDADECVLDATVLQQLIRDAYRAVPAGIAKPIATAPCWAGM